MAEEGQADAANVISYIARGVRRKSVPHRGAFNGSFGGSASTCTSTVYLKFRKSASVQKAPIVVTIKAQTPAEKQRHAVDRRRLRYELGTLVQTWSLLHEKLADIFYTATGCPIHVSNSMWQSVKSDLAQRELLLAALKAQIDLLSLWEDDEEKLARAKAFGEYYWAVTEITKFSHTRNDLIHSPIIFFRYANESEYEVKISDQNGNPRAAKLKEKDIYQLCRWAIAFCDDVQKFIGSVIPHQKRHGVLPPRPRWKLLSSFPGRKQAPRRTPVKRPKRRRST